MFSWIPIYTELATKVLAYHSRQTDLIKMLNELQEKGIPVGSITDRGPKDKKIPLTEIDPFTFFGCFNRGANRESRQAILTYFKARFELQAAVPTDFDGVPVVMALAAWFFPYKNEREADDISSLWSLAEAVVQGPPEELDPKLYERCLRIEKIGPAKLTMGMFWLNPKHYVAWDGNNRRLFQQKGIEGEIKTLSGYVQLIKEVNAEIGTDYPEISRSAWEQTNAGQKQYWAGGGYWGAVSKLDEFIDGNFWQIGWKKEDKNPAAKKTWAHFEQIKVGDEFAIKTHGGRNDLLIHFLGEVVDKTDEGVLKLKKISRPLYKGKGPAGASWFGTIVPIKLQTIIDTIFHGAQPIDESSDDISDASKSEAPAMNIVLYGPPGTGKTYHTIDRAVSIIDPSFSGTRMAFKQRFDEMARKGRLEFVTFHQSYSYEDFVEGIRPVIDGDEESDSPRYECRPGTFKRLATNALFDCLETVKTAKMVAPFDSLWRALLEKIEAEPDAKYPGLTDKTSYQLSLTPRGNIEGNNVISNKKFFCSRKVLEAVFEARRNQDSVTVSEVMAVVARGCHSQLVAAIFNELRRIEKSQFFGKVQQPREIAHTEEERAEIVQRFLAEGDKSGYQLKPQHEWNKYVLIIDEINRGNISKILGELITLIEPDKRLQAVENESSLAATLPYSGERFTVPANLYLLATMNTADKSIALVDVALRRRFEFEELKVDLSICKELSQQMRSALQELNRRIILRKDRDHQIGHAYFVRVTDEASFDRQFRKQIIPLLQEYFYNDWDGLRYVLGETATSESGFVSKIAGADIKEARTKWQWFFDAGAVDLNCLHRLCGNYQIP